MPAVSATLLGLISIFASFTTVSPLPVEVNTIKMVAGDGTLPAGDPGNPGGVYICDGIDWTGNCWYHIFDLTPPFECIHLTNMAQIGSIGPDLGTEVELFANIHCQGHADSSIIAINITYPGNTAFINEWRDASTAAIIVHKEGQT